MASGLCRHSPPAPPVIPPPLPAMLGWIARPVAIWVKIRWSSPGPQALWIGLQRARDLAWGCIWLLISMPTQPARRSV